MLNRKKKYSTSTYIHNYTSIKKIALVNKIYQSYLIIPTFIQTDYTCREYPNIPNHALHC